MKDLSWLERTQLLTGEEGLKKLSESNVLVVGLGGVGSYAAEAIARAGVGKMTIVDGDVVDKTNRNRQLIALSSTQGLSKTQIMAERIKDVNPEIELNVKNIFLDVKETRNMLFAEKYDYVIDAIDSITPKLTLISTCYWNKIKLISSMGAGGRMDASKVVTTDISKSYNCVLAQTVRKRLHAQNIYGGVQVVFSKEEVYKKSLMYTQSRFKKSAYGTISYLPAIFGLTCASVVIRDLSGWSSMMKQKKEKAKRKQDKNKND